MRSKARKKKDVLFQNIKIDPLENYNGLEETLRYDLCFELRLS